MFYKIFRKNIYFNFNLEGFRQMQKWGLDQNLKNIKYLVVKNKNN